MRRILTVLLPMALALTLTAPAHAAVVVRQDKLGDAPAAIDVAKARYVHGSGRVAVLATIPDLGRKGVADLAVSSFGIFEAGYVVRIVKRIGKPARVRLLFFDHFDLHRRSCDGIAGAWNDASIRLRVPIRCLKEHAAQDVFVQFGIRRGQQFDRVPAVKHLPRN